MIDVSFYTERFEFGNAISCGFLFPYNLKLNCSDRFHVGVNSRMILPKEWTDLWFDEYSHSIPNRGQTRIGDKRPIEDLVFSNVKAENFYPIPIPKINRPISEKYIVLIPTIRELIRENPHKMDLVLPIDEWKVISEYIRSKKIKVVSFSSYEACTKKLLEEISDICFFTERSKLLPFNSFIENQLRYMFCAETNISFGGSVHIAYSFDIPGIIYDGQIYSNYKNISDILSSKKKNCYYLPLTRDYIKSNGCENFKENLEIFKKFNRNRVEIILSYIEKTINA